MSLETTASNSNQLKPFIFVPKDYDELHKLAVIISKSDLAPKDYRGKPENTFIAMQMGAELGLHPMQAVQGIAVINGRPSIWGDAMLALCYSSPLCEFINEWSEGDIKSKNAVYYCEAKRVGSPKSVIRTFSVQDAIDAGLWTKSGTWQQYKPRMMQMRARSFALRDAFADLLKGLSMAEEAIDLPKEDYELISVSDKKGVEGLKSRLTHSKQQQAEESPIATFVSSQLVPDSPKDQELSAAEVAPQEPEQQATPAITLQEVMSIIETAPSLDELDVAVDWAKYLTEAERGSIRAPYMAKRKELKKNAQQGEQDGKM